MKILHLVDASPRSSPIYNQALLALNANFSVNMDYFQLGNIRKPRCDDIEKEIERCDIILNGCPSPDYVDLLDEKQAWHKVITYDYSDTYNLEKGQDAVENKSLRYFKRSRTNSDRQVCSKNTYPLDYSILEEYYHPKDIPRIHDVGCFFSYENPYLGSRRRNLLDCLLEWGPPNSLISKNSEFGSRARNSIAHDPHDNPFLRYREQLKKCKIVFTAYPEKYDGDNRTWEAFASGAMVCKDKTWIESPHPFINEKHCILFDAGDKCSIKEAIEKAKWYLRHDTNRVAIAQEGYEFARRYHNPTSRLAYLLNHPNYLYA